MTQNQPFSADTGKLQRYATIAASLDEQLDSMLRRGDLTTFSLDKLTTTPLKEVSQCYPQATKPVSPTCDSSTTAGQKDGISCQPVEEPSLSRNCLPPPAAHNKPSASPSRDPMLRWLSLVCEQLLSLHTIVPLVQKIRQGAVIWYIRDNMANSIQTSMSAPRQSIGFRNNKARELAYRRNRVIHLPVFPNIVLPIRIIFRTLKLHPDDGKDGDGDNIPVIRNNYH
ncbi:hypothetical protein ACTJJB_15240 [Chitinophaga sp. 22536]|uniref:hypothetical protein n=1 Tax=unclassified Chitinophaga TaxID=2619133 RepID=UPI003F86EFB9